MKKKYAFFLAIGVYFLFLTVGRMILLFLYSGMAGGDGSELLMFIFWLLLSSLCFLVFSFQMYLAFLGKFFGKTIPLLLFIAGIFFLSLPLLMYYFPSDSCIGSESTSCFSIIGVSEAVVNTFLPADLFLEFFGSSENLDDYTM